MPRIEQSIAIERPIDKVFAFVTDVAEYPRWISSIVEVTDIGVEVPAVGSTFTEVASFMGKKIETGKVVTLYEPPHRFSHKSVNGPVPQEFTLLLEPSGEHTTLTLVFEAEPGELFSRVPLQVLVAAVKVLTNSNLSKLKKQLDAGVW